jgi:hypothetical protein
VEKSLLKVEAYAYLLRTIRRRTGGVLANTFSVKLLLIITRRQLCKLPLFQAFMSYNVTSLMWPTGEEGGLGGGHGGGVRGRGGIDSWDDGTL